MKEQMPQNCKDIFDIASLDISSCYKAVVIQKKNGYWHRKRNTE